MDQLLCDVKANLTKWMATAQMTVKCGLNCRSYHCFPLEFPATATPAMANRPQRCHAQPPSCPAAQNKNKTRQQTPQQLCTVNWIAVTPRQLNTSPGGGHGAASGSQHGVKIIQHQSARKSPAGRVKGSLSLYTYIHEFIYIYITTKK